MIDTSIETILLRLPAELKRQVGAAAGRTHQSVNSWLNGAVETVLGDDRTGPAFQDGRRSGQASAIKAMIDQLDRTRAALKSWQRMVETHRNLDEAKDVTSTELAALLTAATGGRPGSLPASNSSVPKDQGGRTRMTSMYDRFWRPRVPTIAKVLASVAAGASAQTIDLSGLTEYGRRLSGWSGSVLVWNTGNSGTSGTAAHVKSLVRLLIAESVLDKWPDRVFRLSVNSRGDTLTVKAA